MGFGSIGGIVKTVVQQPKQIVAKPASNVPAPFRPLVDPVAKPTAKVVDNGWRASSYFSPMLYGARAVTDKSFRNKTKPYVMTGGRAVAAYYSGGQSEAVLSQTKKMQPSENYDGYLPSDPIAAQGLPYTYAAPTPAGAGGGTGLAVAAVVGVVGLVLLKGGI